MYKLALYGGAFNPPHAGHANVMIEASRQAEHVLVAPSYRHPYGKVMMDYEKRLAWLGTITERIRLQCDSPVTASPLEYALAQTMEGPIYSFNLLSHAAEINGIDPKSVALVVGPDVAALLPTFYLGAELMETFSIITVAEQIGVRSTLMRQCLEAGDPIPAHWMAPGMDPVDYRIYASETA